MKTPLILAVTLLLSPAHAAKADDPLVLHVAVNGNDANPGTASLPFATLERARDEIRAWKRGDPAPSRGVQVLIHPGHYLVRQPFQINAADSGTAQAPIVYRAAGTESPRFNAGLRLRQFRITDHPPTLEQLHENARGRIWEANLAASGLTNVSPLELGGFGSGRGFRTHPAVELFVDNEPMILARWPNEGFLKTGPVPGALTLPAWDRRPGTPEGRFRFDGDRPARWQNEPDAWLYGYWFWDWADSYEKIERIDLDRREITFALPWHRYGYREGQRYYAVNLLSELDLPGEWYLDRARNRLFLFPKASLDQAVVELSLMALPLLEVDGASHLTFQGLLWECGAADGIKIQGGDSIRLEGCTVRKMAGNGIDIRGGRKHVVQSCDIHTLGRGGIMLAGGDRKSLSPAEHRVENCHIHHLSRIDHTYTPGVWVDGVGQRIRHNLIHHVASSALRIEGNDHLVELNEAHRVVLESDDQGAADMFGNPTYRGNVYRHNYWHHLGNWNHRGDDAHTQRAGIRLDDAICGVLVEGNIFQRCSTGRTLFGGVQIHGGKENLVLSNLFVNTSAAVSFTPWGEKRWREFVANTLNAPAIDRDLYLEKYPALHQLSEHHDKNTVLGNVAVRCETLFLRMPAGTDAIDNRDFSQATEFQEDPDGRLIWSATEAERLGLGHIPFAKIGLYLDQWRRSLADRH